MARSRYDLDRFKDIARALSPAERKKIDESLKIIQTAKEDIQRAERQMADARQQIESLPENDPEVGKARQRFVQAKKDAESCRAVVESLKETLENLKELATVSDSTKDAVVPKSGRIFKYCRDALAGIGKIATVTGDKSLNREIQKIEQGLDRLENGMQSVSTSNLRSVVNKIFGLIPRMLNAAATFMQDLAVTIKASYHQVEGYDNIVSKASKKIWKPKN